MDTIDGLILPTITALAYSNNPNSDEAYEAIERTTVVTRNSPVLIRTSRLLANIIWDALSVNKSMNHNLENTLRDAARSLGLRSPMIKSTDDIS